MRAMVWIGVVSATCLFIPQSASAQDSRRLAVTGGYSLVRDHDIDETLIEGTWPDPIVQSDFTQRGLGVIKRLSRYGTQMQERKLTVAEVKERLVTYHEPYHQELARILAGMRARSAGRSSSAFTACRRSARPRTPTPAGRAPTSTSATSTARRALPSCSISSPRPCGTAATRSAGTSRTTGRTDAPPFEPREPRRERVRRDQQAAFHRHQDVQKDRRLRGDPGVGRGADPARRRAFPRAA